ncbi:MULTISPECIES: hypothetical protein [unclassified Microcoleus]|uniref:hypothetical protein n=1 Tax=unclassified Microcoleus TaxID=2642155 RepID=UPI002FCF1BD2
MTGHAIRKIIQDFQEVVQASKKWHSSEVGQQIDELFAEVYAAFNRDRKSS